MMEPKQSEAMRNVRGAMYELRDALRSMSDDERVQVFAAVMEGYCQHCGSKNLPCHCENDE